MTTKLTTKIGIDILNNKSPGTFNAAFTFIHWGMNAPQHLNEAFKAIKVDVIKFLLCSCELANSKTQKCGNFRN